ncbi:MAG: cyclophane-containing peptide 2OG-Fe(II) oxygenase YhhC [Thiolinea sp.]
MFELPQKITLDKVPYEHFFSQYHISKHLDADILKWFKNDAPWRLVREDFYTQYEFNFIDSILPPYLDFIKSLNYLESLKKTMEDTYKIALQSKFNVVAHKLVKGHVIKVHNDYLPEEFERESHRLLFHFNRDWEESNGGYCMVFSTDDENSLCKIVKPNNFLLQSFAISKNSHHAVSEVKSGERFTIIFTFYQ